MRYISQAIAYSAKIETVRIMFYAQLEEILSSCTNLLKQECYILGDLNIDVLAERNVFKKRFLKLLKNI